MFWIYEYCYMTYTPKVKCGMESHIFFDMQKNYMLYETQHAVLQLDTALGHY